MHSTWASLLSTARSTEKLSCAVTARMPGTLFALIATPSPVPHTSSEAAVTKNSVPAATFASLIVTL